MKIIALIIAIPALLCAAGGLLAGTSRTVAPLTHDVATIDGGVHPILLGRMTVTATSLP
ncbi:MAG: hypothetical protein ABW164_04960 [Sphingobium sp.]